MTVFTDKGVEHVISFDPIA